MNAPGKRGDRCGDQACKVARRREQQQKKLARQARLDADYLARCDQVRHECEPLLQDGPAELRCMVFPLPHFARPLVPLPAERRENFTQNLRQAIGQYRAGSVLLSTSTAPPLEEAPSAAASPVPLLLTACATCGGRCCERGGDHAFITAEAIAQYCHHHPAASDDQIEADYLVRLPPQLLQDSCIYHSGQGCTLPRSLRSVTCNNFTCDDLQRMELQLQEPPPDRWLLASMADGQIVSTQVVVTPQPDRAGQPVDS